jgi:MFS family permease
MHSESPLTQCEGINVTSYYMSYIFINALGIGETLSRILAACGSVDYLIFACLAYFVIERYGRRKVMMCSAAACAICWYCIAIATGLSQHGGNSYVLGSVAVAFFFAFFASFGMVVFSSKIFRQSTTLANHFFSSGCTRCTLAV